MVRHRDLRELAVPVADHLAPRHLLGLLRAVALLDDRPGRPRRRTAVRVSELLRRDAHQPADRSRDDGPRMLSRNGSLVRGRRLVPLLTEGRLMSADEATATKQPSAPPPAAPPAEPAA